MRAQRKRQRDEMKGARFKLWSALLIGVAVFVLLQYLNFWSPGRYM